jgi:serine/threonine protein kinase
MNLNVGTQIKHYTLERLLGQGASGEVWKATDGQRPVAIKFMNENLLSSKNAEKHRLRLQREIDALEKLHHPNIPELYDYDLDYQRPYIAMEYVSDEPYDRMIARGQMLNIELATRMRNLHQLADALHSAHELDIIHRDIKPGNVAGINKGYLLDFSVALKQEDVMHTMMEVGTSLYKGPNDDQPDALNDNYAFGLVAYEVLFGTHAIFRHDDRVRTEYHARIMAGERLRDGTWRMPSKVPANEMPLDLRKANLKRMDEVFGRMLGDRAQRYTDARSFVADLSAALPQTDMNATFMATPEMIQEYMAQQAANEQAAASAAPAAPAVQNRVQQPEPVYQAEAEVEEVDDVPFVAPQVSTAENFTQLEVEGDAEAKGTAVPSVHDPRYSTQEAVRVGSRPAWLIPAIIAAVVILVIIIGAVVISSGGAG